MTDRGQFKWPCTGNHTYTEASYYTSVFCGMLCISLLLKSEIPQRTDPLLSLLIDRGLGTSAQQVRFLLTDGHRAWH